jgi:CheY-like chemotaxis protein
VPRCSVDPAQFEAAVMNLVINARDAMPNGGRVRLRTRKAVRDEIPAYLGLTDREYVAFTVDDNGEGMRPEVASRALEPFYTTKEIGKGSGLGLSTVYGFVTQSGGGLHINSTPGAGTCVTLYLPIASPSADEEPGRPTADQHLEGSGSILIVEDDDDVREVSVAILQGLGYRTIVARNGVEARALLRGPEPIDLLFSDQVMPGGISGIALAREARLLRPGIAILLTTGYAGSDTLPTDEFTMISKPFRSAELSRLVAGLIAEHRSRPRQAE